MSNSGFGRRSFLTGVGVGLAAPMILPARARGANGRIRVGFIGVGKMGMGHLKWFVNQADVEVRAIADVEQSRRELAKKIVEDKNAALKREAGGVSLYVDYKEMLGKDEVDAVVISTPDHWHIHPLVHAAQARKDIYCEKPLTLTIEESDLAVKAVRKHKVILQTGSQQRSENDGRFRIAAEYIRAGRLGKITGISAHFGATAKAVDLPEEPMAEGLEWDRWLGQAPARPYHHLLCQRGDPDKYPFLPGWRDYREYSGGQVTDWGCHHLDIVQWALGMDGALPTQALPTRGDPARGGAQLVYAKTPVGDSIVVTHRTYGNGIRFFGERGEIWVNRGELTATPGDIWKEPLSELKLAGASDGKLEQPAEPKAPPKITGLSHRREWLDCVRSRKDPICKVEVGAGTASVCHLLNAAYWSGKAVGPTTPGVWRSRKARKGFELPRV